MMLLLLVLPLLLLLLLTSIMLNLSYNFFLYLIPSSIIGVIIVKGKAFKKVTTSMKFVISALKLC